MLPRIGERPLVYVAGPVRADSAWERACNVHRAQAEALEIQNQGAITFLPHTEFGPFTGEWSEEFILILCKSMILRSDAVYTVPRWEKSAGTLDELLFAGEHSIPVFHVQRDLAKFIDEYAAKKASERFDASRKV